MILVIHARYHEAATDPADFAATRHADDIERQVGGPEANDALAEGDAIAVLTAARALGNGLVNAAAALTR